MIGRRGCLAKRVLGGRLFYILTYKLGRREQSQLRLRLNFAS